MKRVLKMKSNLKYIILVLIDLAIIFNLPLILKNSESLNAYRYNIIILFIFILSNAIAIYKIIENN